MQKCMVLKLQGISRKERHVFENDVEMYGAQTFEFSTFGGDAFENDVEMYGAQTD